MCTEKENTKIYQFFNEIEMWKGKAINAEHKAEKLEALNKELKQTNTGYYALLWFLLILVCVVAVLGRIGLLL